MSIVEKIAEIERRLAEVKAEMKSKPKELVDEVEEFLGTSHDPFTINLGRSRLKKSLAAEKKRQHIARHLRGFIREMLRAYEMQDKHSLISQNLYDSVVKVAKALDAYDSFEKSRDIL